MKYIFGIRFCAAALSLATLSLHAQTLSPEQTQAVRNDASLAGQALERLDKAVSTPEARAQLEIARGAVSRIAAQFDLPAGQTVGKAEDVYAGGRKYPPMANVTIESFDVPVDTGVVHVPVTLDKPSPNTVIAHVRVYDGQGGRATPDVTKPVIFYPGDPLTKTVSFNVANMTEGNSVKAVQAHVPDGANRKGSGILITAKAGAVNTPIEGGRAGRAFAPSGALCFDQLGRDIQFDDQGGPMIFSTSLSHGRTQVGNGETGYYGTVDMGGFSRSEEGLVISSRRLDAPVKIGSPATEYPFLASMLSGHKTPETHFKYGSVQWTVKMPNRRGAWPALWLVSAAGWPPEIDVYEGFGYNGSWRFGSDLSSNLHGGFNQQRTFTRSAMTMKMSDFGLPNTLDSEFHVFAVTVEPEWITMFVDGVETMRYANPFAGHTWYPLTNVAVKASPAWSYDQGSGDMVLKSLKIWRKE